VSAASGPLTFIQGFLIGLTIGLLTIDIFERVLRDFSERVEQWVGPAGRL